MSLQRCEDCLEKRAQLMKLFPDMISVEECAEMLDQEVEVVEEWLKNHLNSATTYGAWTLLTIADQRAIASHFGHSSTQAD